MNPTIKTIAKAAGVSTATVSKALNDMPDISAATKRHIRQICQEMGYTPNASARSLVSGNTRTIGMLVADIVNPNVGEVARSVMSRMMQHDYSLFLYDSNNSVERESQFIRSMIKSQVAAIIVQPVQQEEAKLRDWEAELTRARTPYISLFSKLSTADGSILVDGAEGGRLAARHLYQKGHKNCDVFMPAVMDQHYAQRVHGFRAYMKAHGCTARLCSAPVGIDGEKAGYALAQAWRGAKETAVFAVDDSLAAGALAGFQERKIRVPTHVSLIGYGDMPYAALKLLRLTTIRPPTLEMGICACDAVVGIIEKKDVMRQYSFSPILVERDTVKARHPVPV